MYFHTYLYNNMRINFTPNTQKLKTAQMLINIRMDKLYYINKIVC